jgi:hypothetical protein
VRALVLVAVALIAGCSDPENTQYLPVGSRCSSSGQCGTTPYDCSFASGLVGGYCTKSCTTDGDCPLDSTCQAHSCFRRCTKDSDCREAEGYYCAPVNSFPAFCAPRPAPMDLGPPSG